MLWLYHPEKEPELFEDSQEAEMLVRGWVDTPDKFPKEGANVTGEADRDFSDFTRPELKKYAFEVFGVKIDARKTKKSMIETIEGYYDSHRSD